MRLLLSSFFLALMIGHIGALGLARYLPAFGILLLLVLVPKRLAVPTDLVYLAFCIVMLVSASVPLVTHGATGSVPYVVAMGLSMVCYPIYSLRLLSRSDLLPTLVIGVALVSTTFVVGRSGTIFDNSNNLSTVIFCLAYVWAVAFAKQPSWLLVGLVVFPPLLITAGSRAQTVGLILFIGLYVYQKVLRNGRPLRKSAVLLLVGVSTAYFAILLGEAMSLIEGITEFMGSEKQVTDVSYRDVLALASIQILAENPLGVGLGYSGIYIERLLGIPLSPHNAFLKIAVEAGLVFALAYVGLLVHMLLRYATPLATAFTIGMFVRSLFESATPFSLSLVSAFLFLPFFFNEYTVRYREKRRSPLSPISPGSAGGLEYASLPPSRGA